MEFATGGELFDKIVSSQSATSPLLKFDFPLFKLFKLLITKNHISEFQLQHSNATD